MGEKDHSDRALGGDASLTYVPLDTIRRIRRDVADPIVRAGLLADICRINTLYMIMNAGSGHIGSSFSSMDLITWLWTEAQEQGQENEIIGDLLLLLPPLRLLLRYAVTGAPG